MDSVLRALAQVILVVTQMLQVVIFISVVISWVGGDPSNQMVQMVRSITEPLYRPFRPLARKIPGPIDWAPMLLILLLVFIDSLVRHLFLR